jgi:flagellar FliL protein
MADEDDVVGDDEAEGLDGDDGGGGGRKKFSKRSLLLFVVLPLVLLGGAGAGAWVSGLGDPLLAMVLGAPAEGEAQEEQSAVPAGPVSYYELPQMLVNLSNDGRKSSFLKIVVSLEVTGEGASHALDEALPRIVDNFQVYLRDLRVEDLRGSAGVYRLREELLFRVNAAVEDVKVTDVLFKEMLVQ